MDQHQINVRYQEAVYKIERDGKRESFTIHTDKGIYTSKICSIAIGIMGRPNKPGYSVPPEIRSRVSYDITSKEIKDMSVLVVGGGDSASEYVQYLNDANNRVSLSYRKSTFTRMNESNLNALMKLEKTSLVNILRDSNIASLQAGENGTVKVSFKETKYGERLFDHLVFALGGTTPKNFLKLVGIKFDGEQPLISSNFESSVPGLFLIGDLSASKRGGSIISAFNSAHEAMNEIRNNYLI